MCVAPLIMFNFVFASYVFALFFVSLGFVLAKGLWEFLCVVLQERPMCACCAICPGEAPRHLGLRVLKERACRGEKQQKVGWSKTMVWPPSAPSRKWPSRGARKGRCAVQGRKNRQVSGPRTLRAGSGRVGALERSVVLFTGKKTTQLLYVPGVG